MKLDEDKVRASRERQGLTVALLAQRARTSKNTILSAEHGGDIRPTTARKIAAALGVVISDLLPEDADSPLGGRPPSVQLTLNGVLAEERRRPTESELKALDRWVSYLERRMDKAHLTLSEIEHDLDAALAFGFRKAPSEYPDDISDRLLQVIHRLLTEGKSFTKLQAAVAELEAEMNHLVETRKEG